MELLTYPKSEYLLEASLESLHQESQEWLNEIEFWADEMAFFFTLLHKKEVRETFPSEELADLEKELIRIHGDRLDTIKSSVQRHERILAAVLKTTSLQEEESYRTTHRQLLMEIYALQLLVRNFKKTVFSFAKNYESN